MKLKIIKIDTIIRRTFVGGLDILIIVDIV